MANVGQDLDRACAVFYEILKCVDSCSEEDKKQFNAMMDVSKIIENSSI